MDEESTSDPSELDTAQFNDDTRIDDAATSTESSTSNASPLAQYLWSKKAPKSKGRPKHGIWKHSRDPESGEKNRDKHGHLLFYCRYCTVKKWHGTQSNAKGHLSSKHLMEITETQTVAQRHLQATIDASFSAVEQQAHRSADERTQNTLLNAVDPESYRNAVARLIVKNSLSRRLVESPEWIAMCLTLN
jgi:hypothetical protein